MKFYFVDRKTQIRHFTDLCFLKGYNPSTSFDIEFSKKEMYALQIAAVSQDDCVIEKIELKSKNSSQLFCVNTDGVDKWGKPFSQKISIKANTIQPLFFMLDFRGTQAESDDVEIEIFTNIGKFKLSVKATLTDEEVSNSGFDDLWRLSRLSWLNSKVYEDERVVKPFLPIRNDGLNFEILGRKIEMSEIGLPKAVYSYFDESIELCEEKQCELFSEPMQLELKNQTVSFEVKDINSSANRAVIKAFGENENVLIEIISELFYEGYIEYSYKITAKKDTSIDDVLLNFSLSEYATKYMNGFSKQGGKIENMSAKFDKTKHQDCLFLGNVNTGLRFKLKDENYQKPLINIYYHNQELIIPENTWDNHGKGELKVNCDTGSAKVEFSTRMYALKEGESHTFSMEIHITPFKPVDYRKQYGVRYFHNNSLGKKTADEYKDLKEAKKKGLNYIIYHHGSRVHPYINYPFIEVETLKNITDAAAEENIATKVYYTVREHSNHMAETFAYKALGNEIIMRKKGDGMTWLPGGVSPWLKEYFGDTVIPAWRVNFKWTNYKGDDDVTFIVNPNSRLDNYYIEGLDYLVKNIGIKGIYIDDTALDRTTIERAKKCLDNVDGLIDLHTWNHHEARAGECSCVNLYTELFPFIDSGWIGEGFNVKELDPDFIMTEVALMPYGLGSQMLEGGGDLYIGMLYAMSNRYGWGIKNADIQYKLWDDFGIKDSKMLGYWHSQNPVKPNNENVCVTVYKKQNKALVCMYNFGKIPTNVSLEIDNQKLGFSPVKTAHCPKIKGKQMKKNIKINSPIQLKGRGGLIFELSE